MCEGKYSNTTTPYTSGKAVPTTKGADEPDDYLDTSGPGGVGSSVSAASRLVKVPSEIAMMDEVRSRHDGSVGTYDCLWCASPHVAKAAHDTKKRKASRK